MSIIISQLKNEDRIIYTYTIVIHLIKIQIYIQIFFTMHCTIYLCTECAYLLQEIQQI